MSQVDLWDGKQRLSVTALSDDQRLGILPCAMALQRLLAGDLPERGVVHPAAWPSPRTGIGALLTCGVRVETGPSTEPAHPPAEGLPLDGE